MLLAGGECQNEAAATFRVPRFADDAAGHLPHVLLLRRQEPDKRSAIGDRNAERLRFAADDIGPARRSDEGERQGFRNSHNNQAAGAVDARGYFRHRLENAEKVRRLREQASRPPGHLAFELPELELSSAVEGELLDVHALVLEVCP